MSISESSSSNINNNGKKDRHIDEFLSEIKNKQEGNDASSFFEIASSNKELQKGSYDVSCLFMHYLCIIYALP